MNVLYLCERRRRERKQKSRLNIFSKGLRQKKLEFRAFIYINIYISEMKVASIMTQSRGHIMYSGRVLNTSLNVVSTTLCGRICKRNSEKDVVRKML